MELKTFVAQDLEGNALPDALVFIFTLNTQDIIDGLEDHEGNTLTNPFNADAQGIIKVAAPNGRYSLRVVAGGRDYTVPVSFFDATQAVSDIAGYAAEVDEDRQLAEGAKQYAEAARDAVLQAGAVYADTVSGLATTAEADYFSVPSGETSEHLILYRHDAGPVATEIKRYPSAEGLDSHLATLMEVNDELVQEVRTAKTSALSSEQNASDSASTATTQAGIATQERSLVQTMRDTIQGWYNNLNIVVDNISAAFKGPGIVPLTDANGELSEYVMSSNIAGLKEQLAGLNVVAMSLYDTSKDSDSGAWRDRCEHLPWYSEDRPSGKYWGALSPNDGELAAVAADMVAGDWYYATSGGASNTWRRILVSGSGGSEEIFRAGSQKFPSKALIVVEADRVIIFDVSGKQATMWMVAKNLLEGWLRNAAVPNLVATNGRVFLPTTNAGLFEFDLVGDSAYQYTTSGKRKNLGGFALRNSANGWGEYGTRGIIVSNLVNDVSFTVLPDAPIDPDTGLKIPTVAVATAGSVSVIHNDGSVANSAVTWANSIVEFDDNYNLIHWREGERYASVVTHGNYDADGFTTTYTYFQPSHPSAYQSINILSGSNDIRAIKNGWAFGGAIGLSVLHENPSSPLKGMAAHITDTYNTGWMVGDVQGAWLCDTETGVISAPELVVDADILSNWTALYQSAVTLEGSSLRITSAGGTNPYARFTVLGLTVGKQYRLKATLTDGTTGAVARLMLNNGTDSSVAAASYGSKSPGSTAATEVVFDFVATTSICQIKFSHSSAIEGTYFDVDTESLSLQRVVEDRSGNGNHLELVGTLDRETIDDGEIAFWRGFVDNTNYVTGKTPAIGAGEFMYYGVINLDSTNYRGVFDINPGPSIGNGLVRLIGGPSGINMTVGNAPVASQLISPGKPVFFAVFRDGNGDCYLYADGKLNGPTNNLLDIPEGINVTYGLFVQDGGTVGGGHHKLSNIKFTTTAPTLDQLKKMERDTLAMIQGKATLDGHNSYIKALAYDKERGLLHATNEGVVSTFRGLQRVNSSLDDKPNLWTLGEVAALDHLEIITNSIPATLRSGHVYFVTGMPDGVITNNGAGWGISNGVFTATADYSLGFRNGGVDASEPFIPKVYEISITAPFTSVDSVNGSLLLGGEGGADINIPSLSVREKLEHSTRQKSSEDFEFQGDATTLQFPLPKGWKPKRVYVDGAKKRQGAAEDYITQFDGFVYSVVFAVAPGSGTDIDVEAVEV